MESASEQKGTGLASSSDGEFDGANSSSSEILVGVVRERAAAAGREENSDSAAKIDELLSKLQAGGIALNGF